MKKTKLISGVALLTMAALLFAGCKSDDASKKETASSSTVETVASTTEESTVAEKIAGADMQDGTYKLEEKNFDDKGWKVQFTITVKDKKITESTFDYVNEAGEKKSENKEYDEMMKEKAGIGPSEFVPALNEALIASQSADGVEVVTGATHSTDGFKNYAQQLIQAAQAGNTETIEINNGADLQDGTYTLEEKNYSNNYRVVFSIVVKDGKIAESKYDNVNEAGDSKTADTDYDEMMKEKAGVGPSEFIPALNEALVKAQSAEVDVVTGATHSTHTFQLYAAQLINAAQAGNTDKIEVDNVVYAK